ncbi:MAG: hypothetical protein ACLR13_00420 [Acutalibacteraceae bacterium]
MAVLRWNNTVKQKHSMKQQMYMVLRIFILSLTGTLPEKAIKRKEDARLLIPTGILKELPPHVVTSLANGLQVYPQKRTQTFERLVQNCQLLQPLQQ